MTIKEIYDKAEDFSEEQRVVYLGGLSKHFSGCSMSELRNFQNNWNSEKGMDAFFAEQVQVFKKCIALEISDFGKTVRATLGLEPLLWDTEIS